MEHENDIEEDRGEKAVVDTLLSDTFNSILRIEERSLKNRLTEGLSIAELHTIVAVGLHETNSMKVVASRLDVTMATLTAAMNKLERKGFVERMPQRDGPSSSAGAAYLEGPKSVSSP